MIPLQLHERTEQDNTPSSSPSLSQLLLTHGEKKKKKEAAEKERIMRKSVQSVIGLSKWSNVSSGERRRREKGRGSENNHSRVKRVRERLRFVNRRRNGPEKATTVK